MTKVCELRYKDVENFSKGLNRKTKKSTDALFKNICSTAMSNTLEEAEKLTPVWSGELKKSWRDDVEAPHKRGKTWVTTAVNEAFNERAAEVGMEGHYASYIEEGHKKVPWRKNTHGIHMLAKAEVDTERKLQQIADDEVRKFFGGLFS